ncbi:hypothetical protein [uncultured Clostridium sp.]|uniref:hypothetical protein n=1 Tax=uncultured Clostridium sp. TaxID=59620 RepID=UPI00345BC4B6
MFDKVPCDKLRKNVSVLKNINPGMVILAAGGIDEKNIKDYVETGVDAIVTSCIYYARPIDIGCK